MVATNLFSPPPVYALPLTKGSDLVIDFRSNPSGDGATFVDWDSDLTVTLVIDTAEGINAVAVIDGYHATVRVNYTVADVIPKNVLWRMIVSSSATTPSTEIVACNGKTARFDGN
jgi:hypothetical protein